MQGEVPPFRVGAQDLDCTHNREACLVPSPPALVSGSRTRSRADAFLMLLHDSEADLIFARVCIDAEPQVGARKARHWRFRLVFLQ